MLIKRITQGIVRGLVLRVRHWADGVLAHLAADEENSPELTRLLGPSSWTELRAKAPPAHWLARVQAAAPELTHRWMSATAPQAPAQPGRSSADGLPEQPRPSASNGSTHMSAPTLDGDFLDQASQPAVEASSPYALNDLSSRPLSNRAAALSQMGESWPITMPPLGNEPSRTEPLSSADKVLQIRYSAQPFLLPESDRTPSDNAAPSSSPALHASYPPVPLRLTPLNARSGAPPPPLGADSATRTTHCADTVLGHCNVAIPGGDQDDHFAENRPHLLNPDRPFSSRSATRQPAASAYSSNASTVTRQNRATSQPTHVPLPVPVAAMPPRLQHVDADRSITAKSQSAPADDWAADSRAKYKKQPQPQTLRVDQRDDGLSPRYPWPDINPVVTANDPQDSRQMWVELPNEASIEPIGLWSAEFRYQQHLQKLNREQQGG